MPRMKAIATPPGEPTRYEPFTEEEELARDAEEAAEAKNLMDAEAIRLRSEEKGGLQKQLDMIREQGVDAWKAHLDAVEARHPLPSEQVREG